MFKKQNGFTLIEVMIASAIFAVVALIAASLMLETARFGTAMEHENNRAQITQQVLAAIRNPSAIEASLTQIYSQQVGCLTNPASLCNVTAGETPFSLSVNRNVASLTDSQQRDQAALTASAPGSNGIGYYTDAGTKCDSTSYNDASKCPVKVSTTYALLCPSSSAGGRQKCPTAQAAIALHYTVEPNLGTLNNIRADQSFAKIDGYQNYKVSALYSAASTGATSVDARDLSTQDRQLSSTSSAGQGLTKQCSAGQIMSGIAADGSVKCVSISQTCNRGEVFTGFVQDPAGQPGDLKVSCASTVCPTGQTFNGISNTGTPVCQKINKNLLSCQPLSGTDMNDGPNQFMTGLDGTAGASCKKLTCRPGQITSCWRNGSVVCTDTNFIPKCPSGSCSAPPTTTPPGTGVYYDSSTVAAGYNGIPFVSRWSNGEPLEGYHMTYRDQSNSTTGTNVLTGLFGDPLGSGALDNCTFESVNNNLTGTHTWCTDGISQFIPYPDPSQFLPCPPYPPYPQPDTYTGIRGQDCNYVDPYQYYDAHTYWPRDCSHFETCTITPNPFGGTATSSCAAGDGTTYPDSRAYTGQTSSNRYSYIVRPSCNYKYTNSSPKCQ